MNKWLLFLCCWCSAQALAEQCQVDKVRLQVLGSGGPEINDGRASSSYLLWFDDKARVLVEAGPGSALNFDRAGADFEDLDGILLTHLHVDHSADLPALIKGAYFSNRRRDLPVLGPDKNALMPATSEFVQRLFGPQGAFNYLSNFLPDGRSAFDIRAQDVALVRDKIQGFDFADDLRVEAVFTHHGPLASVAWRVNLAGCSVVFSGDMSNQYNSLATLAAGAHILVANNAIPESAGGVARNLHMPPSMIGQIAAKAKVKTLILSHFMNRTLSSEVQTRELIGQHYQGPVELANDMDTYSFR